MAQLATARVASSLKLMIDQLSSSPVDHLPSLDDVYASMMSTIEQKPEEERSLAKRALSWVLFARRPLKETELHTALGIEAGSSKLDGDSAPDDTEIAALGESLVQLTKVSVNEWYLIHSSAADYQR